jgi:hypothetical protein
MLQGQGACRVVTSCNVGVSGGSEKAMQGSIVHPVIMCNMDANWLCLSVVIAPVSTACIAMYLWLTCPSTNAIWSFWPFHVPCHFGHDMARQLQ